MAADPKAEALKKMMANDSEVESNLKSLFDTLRGKVKEQTVAVSTLMALLINLKIDQEEPEFFSYVWKKCSNKQVE